MSLNLRSVDLNLLPVFDALIREQHLSRASEQLAMSQPAVSNALKRLRITFKDDLFIRTSHGLTPTARALELHQSILPALQLLQQSYSEQGFDPKTSDQTLRLSMNAATEHILAPILMSWLRYEAPQMKVQLSSDQIEDIPSQLKNGKLDYAIDYTSYDDKQFHSIVLNQQKLNVICSSHHKHIQGEISLKQFKQFPHVSVMPRSNLDQSQGHLRVTPFEQIMGKDLPERNVAMHVSSFVAIPNIVATTDLIATIPTQIAQLEHFKNKVQILELPFDYPAAEIRLIWHKSRDNNMTHQWFLDKALQLAKVIR